MDLDLDALHAARRPANAAGSVASPSGIAPGSLSVKVAKAGLLKSKVTGKVAQGGAGVGGAKVEVWAGKTKGRR